MEFNGQGQVIKRRLQELIAVQKYSGVWLVEKLSLKLTCGKGLLTIDMIQLM
jgi:hypothetical protein